MRRALLVVLALIALALPASTPGAGGITVFAAASLSDVFQKLDRGPTYNFAGSDQLALQIRQGAPADIYAAASPKQPGQLYAEGLVLKPHVFATNELVLIVPRSNPAKLHSVYDLRRNGIKLVIGQTGVPIGDYTRAALKKLGLSSVLTRVVSEETDVKHIVGKVALGEADAGFVYRTDVKPAARKLRSIALPARAQPKVRYELAVVKATKRRPQANAFVARVLGQTGRRALRGAGFGLPPVAR
jgi:molybdate transport system substrate-binding protein